MPIFGGNPLIDFVLLFLPFIVVVAINPLLARKLPVAPTGIVGIGIFCILTRAVEYRTLHQEGAVAVGIGLVYIIFGLVFVLKQMKDSGKRS